MPIERSLAPILLEDLKVFASFALTDRADFFSRHQREEKFLLSALCQGAAKHYVDGINGVKDVDIWSFFEKSPDIINFPVRRRVARDLGESKFGVHPDDKEAGFQGRRIDLLGRSIDVALGEKPVDALQRYLQEAKTSTAWYLSQKPVVIIDPPELIGQIIWPVMA